MKWVVFIVAALCLYPAGRWLRERPALRHLAWALIGFLPFYAAPSYSLYFFAEYPGDTHGLEVGIIDWLVLSLLLAYRRPARPLPYRFPLVLYLLVALLSATQAQWLVLSAGYAWKLGRMYLLFAVVWRAGEDRPVPFRPSILRPATLRASRTSGAKWGTRSSAAGRPGGGAHPSRISSSEIPVAPRSCR